LRPAPSTAHKRNTPVESLIDEPVPMSNTREHLCSNDSKDPKNTREKAHERHNHT